MDTDRELLRKLVRSTIAEYEVARAAGNIELLTALHELSRAAYELETRFENRGSAATAAMLAIVTTDYEVARSLYVLALEQNRSDPDHESYVWRLNLWRRFAEARLIPWTAELEECRALAAQLGDSDAKHQADSMLVGMPI